MSDDAHTVSVVMEKSVLMEFLQLYKSFPCLWDQKHMLYGNREMRTKAYEVLLNKYKLVHEGAEVKDVKKKLEYMRCAYRREHKKVIMAQIRGAQYKPSLYYYDRLKFLNDNELEAGTKVTHIKSRSQETHEIEDSDDEATKPKMLRMLLSESDPKNEIYLTDHRHDLDDESLQEDQSEHGEQEQEETETSEPYVISTEAESFGRTVGFQLKELPRLQRVYAEKLISDVIFKARLGNLKADTSIHDDSD